MGWGGGFGQISLGDEGEVARRGPRALKVAGSVGMRRFHDLFHTAFLGCVECLHYDFHIPSFQPASCHVVNFNSPHHNYLQTKSRNSSTRSSAFPPCLAKLPRTAPCSAEFLHPRSVGFGWEGGFEGFEGEGSLS